MFVGMTLECLIGMGLCMFGLSLHMTLSWVHLFYSVRNEILQSPNPRERDRECCPCVNLHREKIISASVELCETEVRFLHIQRIGTNV